MGHWETKSLRSLNHHKRYHNIPKSLHLQSSSLFSHTKSKLFFKRNRGVMFLSEWSYPQVLSIEGKDENCVHISIHSIGNCSLKIPHIAKWTLKRNLVTFHLCLIMCEAKVETYWTFVFSLIYAWTCDEAKVETYWKCVFSLIYAWTCDEAKVESYWKFVFSFHLCLNMWWKLGLQFWYPMETKTHKSQLDFHS